MLSKLPTICIVLLILLLSNVSADEKSLTEVLEAIKAVKSQNFYVQKLGILVAGSLTPGEIQQLQEIQTSKPRQMAIFVTQNEMVQDVYRDFTFLAKSKQVDAILVWPTEVWSDAGLRAKICQMSMRTMVPVVGMQAGWVERGAMLQFELDVGASAIIANQKVCAIFNYVPGGVAGYTVLAHQ